MTEITIRAAQPDDVPLLVEMIKRLAVHHGDKPAIDAESLRHGAFGATPMITLLIAEMAGCVVGYCALCPLAQLQFGAFGLDIHHLFVQPHARQRGVAQAIIQAVIAHAKTRGCRYITVGTHPDNTRAQAIYLASGFTKISPSGPRFSMRLQG